ncbi:MAG: hypothetical protein HGJ98_12435 [Desulfosporosinus sp.]|nr:hypothetical protein [Desulfosporosinus sp.]
MERSVLMLPIGFKPPFRMAFVVFPLIFPQSSSNLFTSVLEYQNPVFESRLVQLVGLGS